MTDQMTEQLTALEADLINRFPEAISRDERKGYSGYLVGPERLLEFAAYVRDGLGYDFLSSITGVDYLPDGKMEVVYHVFKSTGGPAPLSYHSTRVPSSRSAKPGICLVFASKGTRICVAS
jgi:NADH-quinone oxidoreductase subunit C/D